MLALDNDEFIVYESSFSGAGRFYKLTPYNESEHESVTALTLAMIYDDANVSRKIAAFNRSSDKYHINVESYSEYFKYDSSGKAVNTPVKQLRQDIADGKDIDMVCFSDTSVFYGMSTTDAFADLSGYLGKNGTIRGKSSCRPCWMRAVKTASSSLSRRISAYAHMQPRARISARKTGRLTTSSRPLTAFRTMPVC